MKKFSPEQEEIFRMLVEEAERDIEKNGTISEEEFWALLEDEERSEGIYLKKRRNNIKLHLAKCIGKISRRFIRA